jgi:hypothetical protein
MSALVKALASPHPGRVVDMNDLRADHRVLMWAIRQCFEALSTRPIAIDPRTHMPTSDEIDRVADVLLAFGVKNAQIAWSRERKAWVIG